MNTPRGLWTWQPPLPVLGSHRGSGWYVYVLPGTQRHWTLSLRQNSAHMCREIHASCSSPVCSGCSWPSPSLVGMLSNVGARVQGERPAHRHVELHRDLGRKGGLEKSKRLRISIFCLSILFNSYTILFTASSLFSDFFPQDLVWPRKLLKTSQIYPAKWGNQSPWTVSMK